MSDKAVCELQRVLVKLGFYAGKVDGIYGVKTAAAVAAALAEESNESALPWMDIARGYIGTKEVKGSRHNPDIVAMWQATGQPYNDDETPWCSALVGACLEQAGIKSTRRANARSYLDWGIEINRPAVGAVVVYWRGDRNGWSGHVGFVEGVDERGNILTLGGNQGDAVNVKPFPPSRVLGYRWPSADNVPPPNYAMTATKSTEQLSTNEA